MRTTFLICFLALCGVDLVTPTGKSGGSYQTSYGQQAGVGLIGTQRAYSGPQAVPGQQYYSQTQDGSYDFGYQTQTGGFQSEKKVGSQVAGKYGHTNPDGSFVNVEYQAVSSGRDDNGGVGVGRYAASAPWRAGGASVQAQVAPVAQVYSPGYSTGRLASTGVAAVPAVAAPVVPQYTSPVRPAEYAAFNLQRQNDGSYSYSYSSSDSSKTESGTPDGQVQGSFTFRGDDGVQRAVDYSAGQQGFLASGAHLPVSPDGIPAAGTNADSARFQSLRYSGGAAGYRTGAQFVQPQGYSKAGQSYASYQQVATPVVRPPAVAVPQAYNGGAGFKASYFSSGQYSGEPVDESPKPFAFNYNTGAHARSEAQDASGVVRGSYTVNSPDGTLKEVSYQADDSGFHITGEKQVESGGGASYVSAAGFAGAPAAGRVAVGAGQTYKQKSVHGGGY